MNKKILFINKKKLITSIFLLLSYCNIVWGATTTYTGWNAIPPGTYDCLLQFQSGNLWAIQSPIFYTNTKPTSPVYNLVVTSTNITINALASPLNQANYNGNPYIPIGTTSKTLLSGNYGTFSVIIAQPTTPPVALPPLGTVTAANVNSGLYALQKVETSPAQYLAADGITFQANPTPYLVTKTTSSLSYASNLSTAKGTISPTNSAYWFTPITLPSGTLTAASVSSGLYALQKAGTSPAQYLASDGATTQTSPVPYLVTKNATNLTYRCNSTTFSGIIDFTNFAYWFIPITAPAGTFLAADITPGDYYVQQAGSSPAQYLSADTTSWQSAQVVFFVTKSGTNLNVTSQTSSIRLTVPLTSASGFWFTPCVTPSIPSSDQNTTFKADSVLNGDYWIKRPGSSPAQYLSADGLSWQLIPALFSVSRALNNAFITYTSKKIPTFTSSLAQSSSALWFVMPNLAILPTNFYTAVSMPLGTCSAWLGFISGSALQYILGDGTGTPVDPTVTPPNFTITKTEKGIILQSNSANGRKEEYDASQWFSLVYYIVPGLGGITALPTAPTVTQATSSAQAPSAPTTVPLPSTSYVSSKVPIGVGDYWVLAITPNGDRLYLTSQNLTTLTKPLEANFSVTKTSLGLAFEAKNNPFLYKSFLTSDLQGIESSYLFEPGPVAAAVPIVSNISSISASPLPAITQASTTAYSVTTLPAGTVDCWVKIASLYSFPNGQKQAERPSLPTHTVTKTIGTFSSNGIVMNGKGSTATERSIAEMNYSSFGEYSFEVVAPFDFATTASLIADAKTKIASFDSTTAESYLNDLKNKIIAIRSSPYAMSSKLAPFLATAQATYYFLEKKFLERPNKNDIDDLELAYSAYDAEKQSRALIADLATLQGISQKTIQALAYPLYELQTALEGARQYFNVALPGVEKPAFLV